MTWRDGRLANCQVAQENTHTHCNVGKWATRKCQELGGPGQSMPGCARLKYMHKMHGIIAGMYVGKEKIVLKLQVCRLERKNHARS